MARRSAAARTRRRGCRRHRDTDAEVGIERAVLLHDHDHVLDLVDPGLAGRTGPAVTVAVEVTVTVWCELPPPHPVSATSALTVQTRREANPEAAQSS